MPELDAPAVLHLTTAVGGGVDRYIRDAASQSARRHFIWHAGETIDAIEDVAERRFVALRDVLQHRDAPALLEAWRRSQRIGILHLHGVDRAIRARLALAQPSLPAVATLHDITFIEPSAFEVDAPPGRDPRWIAEVRRSLDRIDALIVPSQYIRSEAERAFGARTIVDIAPGIPPPDSLVHAGSPRTDFAAHARRHTVAIVGAIGPHKGSALVGALADALAADDVRIVVIGYTNERLAPGWVDAHRYYVHGPYDDAVLPALLREYRVDVVLFPNRLAESFSYTLSETWAAGIPAIVPDTGALGERVARHGGGWRLAPRFEADDAARLIRSLFDAKGANDLARVKSQIDTHDADRIPPLASMSRALDRLYERFAVPPPGDGEPASADALAPLLAVNLDGFAFRAELLRFAEELDNARSAIAELQATLAATRNADAQARAWSAKLEGDIEALRREVALRDDELHRLPLPLRAWLRKRALRGRG